MEIFLKVSADGGQTFLINTTSATGDIGFPVSPGTGKQIQWTYPDSLASGDYQIKIVADDRFEIDIQTLVDAVDSNLLRDRLEFIEGIRTFNFGAAHYASVKDTIEAHFTNAGLQTERHSIPPAPTT